MARASTRLRTASLPLDAPTASGSPDVWSSTPQMLTLPKGFGNRTLRFVNTSMPTRRKWPTTPAPSALKSWLPSTAYRPSGAGTAANRLTRSRVVLGAKAHEVAAK